MTQSKPRHHTLCVAVMCCLPLVPTALLAETPIEQRVQRLERILDNRVLIDLLQRIEAVQREMRELRGEIELQRNELANMERRNRDLYIDTDRRLQDIENRASAAASQTRNIVSGSSALAAAATPRDNAAEINQPDTTVAVAVTAVQPGASALIDNSAPENVAEKGLFDAAYLDLVNSRYTAATAGFEKLLSQFPDGDYVPSSLYWLGEAQYAQSRFDAARGYFEEMLLLYPTDKKAPDARLRVGFIEFEMGDIDAARATLEGVVGRHPSTTAALLAQRRLEEIVQ